MLLSAVLFLTPTIAATAIAMSSGSQQENNNNNNNNNNDQQDQVRTRKVKTNNNDNKAIKDNSDVAVAAKKQIGSNHDHGSLVMLDSQIQQQQQQRRGKALGSLRLDFPRLLFASLLDASFEPNYDDDTATEEDVDAIVSSPTISGLDSGGILTGSSGRHFGDLAREEASSASSGGGGEGCDDNDKKYGVPTVASLAALNEAYRLHDLNQTDGKHIQHRHRCCRIGKQPLNLSSEHTFSSHNDERYSDHHADSSLPTSISPPPVSSIRSFSQQQQQQQQQSQQLLLQQAQNSFEPFSYSRALRSHTEAGAHHLAPSPFRARYFSPIDGNDDYYDDDDDDYYDDDDGDGFGRTASVAVY